MPHLKIWRLSEGETAQEVTGTPKRGDLVEQEGAWYEITDIMVLLTPYKKRNQDTKAEGFTMGLRMLD